MILTRKEDRIRGMKRPREKAGQGCPVEAAGAMKMRKTQKQVSRIFTAPWKTRSRKERGGEFPTAPTGPTTGISLGQGTPKQTLDASMVSIQ